MTDEPKGYEQALGAVPLPDGAEPAEVTISRLREEPMTDAEQWRDYYYQMLSRNSNLHDEWRNAVLRGDRYRARALALLAQCRKYVMLIELGGQMGEARAERLTMTLEAAQTALADAIQDNTQNYTRAETYHARARKLALALRKRTLERDIAEDSVATFDETMTDIWGKLYPNESTGWEYPGIVIRHVWAVVDELAAEHERAERLLALSAESSLLVGTLAVLLTKASFFVAYAKFDAGYPGPDGKDRVIDRAQLAADILELLTAHADQFGPLVDNQV